MKKLALILAFLLGSIASVSAACTSPAVMHDFPGTAFNMSLATNAGDGNCASNMAMPSGSIASGAYSSGAFASGSYASGAIGSGAMVDLGAIADAAATTGSTGSVSAKLRLMTTQLNTINTTLGTPMQQTGGSIAPSTLAAWGLVASTQNGATPTNAQLAMAQFNTTPTTITTGNVSPLQMDAAGNLLVNIKAGAGSGGTALADEAVFTQGTTSITPIGCLFITSYTAITTGHAGVLSCTSAGSLHTTVDNANVNGQATMANSSPVVIASNQSAVPTTISVAATGGESTTGNIAANNTTAVVVKASPGTLYGAQLGGIGSAPAYLKLYNATSATCGSGTPVKRLIIPAASTAANGGGSNVSLGPQGVAFSTGITYCVTTGIGDADTTAPAASTYLINLDWN